MTRDRDIVTILAHFRDPESPERAIARAMLRGRTTKDLEAAARDLASTIRSDLRHSFDWARASFLDAGEEHGLVPTPHPALGRVVLH